jgi:hypothetical protein
MALVQTVMIWDEGGEGISFRLLDGDYSHLDHVYANTMTDGASELVDLMYIEGSEGKERFDKLDSFPYEAVHNGAVVIVCGIVP